MPPPGVGRGRGWAWAGWAWARDLGREVGPGKGPGQGWAWVGAERRAEDLGRGWAWVLVNGAFQLGVLILCVGVWVWVCARACEHSERASQAWWKTSSPWGGRG